MSQDQKVVEYHGMQITRERRLEMAVEAFASIASGAMQDLDLMKQNHPPSRRGSRYTHALESLERRLVGLEQEAREAINAKL